MKILLVFRFAGPACIIPADISLRHLQDQPIALNLQLQPAADSQCFPQFRRDLKAPGRIQRHIFIVGFFVFLNFFPSGYWTAPDCFDADLAVPDLYKPIYCIEPGSVVVTITTVTP